MMITVLDFGSELLSGFKHVGLLLEKLGGGVQPASQNPYLSYGQNNWKTISFGAAHTYIAHIKEYPPPSREVQALARFIVLCSWARQFFLGLPLSTQVYKWVLANLTLGVGGGILLASHFSLCNKKWVYSLAWWASRLECRLYLPFLSNTTVLARYKK